MLLWWAFAAYAVLLAPLVVLLSHAVADADPTLGPASTVGVLAALVHLLGLVRRPFLVPYLARVDADPDAGAARREAAAVPGWIGVLGIAIGPVLGLCSLEFVGGQERSGWALAGGLVPIAYVAWSRWLMATGVALLVWALNSRAARPARARPGSGRAAP